MLKEKLRKQSHFHFQQQQKKQKRTYVSDSGEIIESRILSVAWREMSMAWNIMQSWETDADDAESGNIANCL